jgi:hypothetical protein
MKKLFISLFTLLPVLVFGQFTLTRQVAEGSIRSIAETFKPERITVHLNNDRYISGQDIYYKIYVTSYTYFRETDRSVVAYLELTHAGTLLTRQKIKLVNGTGFGNITLPPDLKSGVYQLQCFTAWSKNLDTQGVATHPVVIVNPETADIPETAGTTTTSAIISHTVSGKEVTLNIARPSQGTLVATCGNNILLWESLENRQEFKLDRASVTSGYLNVAILSENQQLVESTTFNILPSDLNIELNRNNYNPRANMELSVSSADLYPLGFSLVNVRSQGQRSIVFSNPFTPVGQLMKGAPEKISFEKERVIYPIASSSLSPVDFEKTSPTVVGLSDSPAPFLAQHKLQKSIADSYQLSPAESSVISHRIPFDQVYYPKDFQPLPTVADFLTEIVAAARVKKIKGTRAMVLRNNEDPNKIYFFKSPPLLIVDGFVTRDFEGVLNIDPADVESITLTFRLNTINQSAVFGLSDNGLLAIYTKSKKTTVAKEFEIYKGFHTPTLFTPPVHKRSDDNESIPDFRQTLYWNPEFQFGSKSKVSFYLSDDLGAFTAEISGLTKDGRFFLIEKAFQVAFESN